MKIDHFNHFILCVQLDAKVGSVTSSILKLRFHFTFDDFVKSPHAALCCILRHCSVRQVRFIPQDLHALPANILQSRPKIDFLRGHHVL